MPELVEWMATQRCSLRCPHCYSAPEHHRLSGPELTLDEVASLFEQVAELGVPELLVSGGEPLERPDLPEVIGLLEQHRIAYSLNTATYPRAEVEAAFRRWPPIFVAVSMDGPPPIHDAFRGRVGSHRDCLRTIELFSRLTGGRVTAGTTVTRHNFRNLDDTFQQVVGSGASAWGLHLVLPEGRGIDQAALGITPREARWLLEYCAARRNAFPVSVCDELGYLGEWEPLVRDAPFRCAAGRTQCVVLPDGQVMPCTTFDQRESAGSLRESSLADIWRDGFGKLRSYEPQAKCRNCGYVSVCGGGCWLMRRRGHVHCYREAWDRRGSLRNAASAAVCLGLAACTRGGEVPQRPEQVSSSPPALTAAPAPPGPVSAPAAEATLEVAPEPNAARCPLATEPLDESELAVLKRFVTDASVWRQVELFLRTPRSPDLAARVQLVEQTFTTETRSLHLASLLWRELALWCLACSPPDQRTPQERELLRHTLARLQLRTAEWRREIVSRRLDPFLARDDAAAPVFDFRPTKRASCASSVSDSSQIAFLHWDMLPSPERRGQLTQAYLSRHPFAASLTLKVRAPAGSGVMRVSRGREVPLHTGPIGIFDGLTSPAGTGVIEVTITHSEHSLRAPNQNSLYRNCDEARLAGGRLEVHKGPGITQQVKLPRGTELTYIDVVRLAYEQYEGETPSRASLHRGSEHTLSPFALMDSWHRLQQAAASDDPPRIRSARSELLTAWLF